MRYNEQLKQHLSKMADDLHPLRVLGLFERIPDEDCEVGAGAGARPALSSGCRSAAPHPAQARALT
jgi:hypothetical protein